MFLLGLEKQRKNITITAGAVCESLLPTPDDMQEPWTRRPTVTSALLPFLLPAQVTGPQGLDLDKTMHSEPPQTPAPNHNAPYPSLWGGQRWKLYWLTVGLSNLEARLFFPYITIIKNNYFCYWIFILTTPGPDICIKLKCRMFSGDFSTAAKLCKN